VFNVTTPAATILATYDRLSITDKPSGVTLRPSPERLLRELKRRGRGGRQRLGRAIEILAERARAASDGLGEEPKRRGAIHPKPPLNCLVRASC